jgi:sec-independent protein translocase protein TatB
LVGPERLPQVAVDAARFIKKVRAMANNATTELRENLGPGFEDLSPSDLRPKTFIKKHIANALDEVDAIDKAPKFKAKIDPDLL